MILAMAKRAIGAQCRPHRISGGNSLIVQEGGVRTALRAMVNQQE
jgi:hypothetical protein